jgi:hypothetical protein
MPLMPFIPDIPPMPFIPDIPPIPLMPFIPDIPPIPLMPDIPAIAAVEAITALNNIAVVILVNLRIFYPPKDIVLIKGCVGFSPTSIPTFSCTGDTALMNL